MATIREIAIKHCTLAADGDDSVAITVAALREFGEELAKLCEAQKIEPGIPGYAAYNAAFSKCAVEIRAAIRESL